MKNWLLERIGKNALFYYGAQGIGASAAVIVGPMVILEVWQFKFLLLLLVNVLVTSIFAEILKAIFEVIYSRGRRMLEVSAAN